MLIMNFTREKKRERDLEVDKLHVQKLQ